MRVKSSFGLFISGSFASLFSAKLVDWAGFDSSGLTDVGPSSASATSSDSTSVLPTPSGFSSAFSLLSSSSFSAAGFSVLSTYSSFFSSSGFSSFDASPSGASSLFAYALELAIFCFKPTVVGGLESFLASSPSLLSDSTVSKSWSNSSTSFSTFSFLS